MQDPRCSHPGRRKEEPGQRSRGARALPPLGHGVGVSGVVNVAVVLVRGHHIWGEQREPRSGLTTGEVLGEEQKGPVPQPWHLG